MVLMKRYAKRLAAALIGASATGLAGSAAAEPITADLRAQSDTVARIELVQWGGFGGWYGPGSSPAERVAPRSDDRSGYDAYAHDGGAAAVAPRASSNAGQVAHCQQRFRSYDPASGTYLGYDGLRHPCP
jgi:BA14K-like protein